MIITMIDGMGHRLYFFETGRVRALARVEDLPGYA
jgi:hypothetical protein